MYQLFAIFQKTIHGTLIHGQTSTKYANLGLFRHRCPTLLIKKKTDDIENIEKKINFIKDNHLNDNLKIFNTDEIVSWSVLACFYILDSFDVQKLFKVFEAELHIKNYQFEVRSLIEYQLKQVKKAQKKCFHQKTCQKSKILPKLLDIYHRLCEQSLNQVNHL